MFVKRLRMAALAGYQKLLAPEYQNIYGVPVL